MEQEWFVETFKLNGSNIGEIVNVYSLGRAVHPSGETILKAMRHVDWNQMKKTGEQGVRLIGQDGTVYLDWDVWDTIYQEAFMAGYDHRNERRVQEEQDGRSNG